MTFVDTPLDPSYPRPSMLDQVKGLIGDLARPFGLYALGSALAAAVVIIALKVENGNDGAIFIGAVGIVFGGAYGFRAWENVQAAKQAANVEVAKAAGPVAQ